MLDLVAELEEIPEIVRLKELEDNGATNRARDSLNRFFFFGWVFIAGSHNITIVNNNCNNNNNNNGGERRLNNNNNNNGNGGEKGINNSNNERDRGLNRCEEEGGGEGRMSPARTVAYRNVAVIEESLYKVNQISRKLPKSVSKESTSGGNNNNNNNNNRRFRSVANKLGDSGDQNSVTKKVIKTRRSNKKDPFEESLEEAAAKVEARMLKLVLALEEVPEIVRKREEVSNVTGDGDLDDEAARRKDSETNRFFFFPWGFVAGSSSVSVNICNNNNNNNNNGGGERGLNRECEGGEGEASGRMSPARLTATRSVKVMEESLYKINLQVKKLPRAIASKSTEVPEESGGNNNSNNNNNNNNNN